MATDFLSLLGGGGGDEDVLRRFLSSRGRLRPEEEATAADTADVQRQLAARQLTPPPAEDDMLASFMAAQAGKVAPAAPVAPVRDADYDARRAAASRTAFVNDTLGGLTEGFDRATNFIVGPRAAQPVRARNAGAVEDAERRFLGQEAEREKRALAERNRPLVEAERAAALEKAKAETAKAQAATSNATADAAYEAALRDVNSPETQAMREFAVSVSAGKLPPELAARMNGIQLRDGAKLATSQLNAEAMAGIQQQRLTQSAEEGKAERYIRMRTLETQIAALESLNENKRLDREQEKELANKKEELERERIALEEEKISARKTKETEASAVAAQKLVDGDTTKLADDFTKAGGPGFYGQYSEAAAILAKYPKDIPGYGQIDGYKPDIAISEDGRAMRQAVGQMLAEYRKGITGAGMSNAERVEYGQITGLIQSADERSVRQGVERLRRAFDNRVRAIAGGYRSDSVSLYASRVPQFREAIAGTGLGAPPKAGTSTNPARSIERVPPPTTLDEPEPETRRPVSKPAIAPGEAIPRLISLKKPDGTRKSREEVKAEIAEGETARFPMGKGADGVMEYRTVKKVGGKIVPVKEGE